MDQKLPAAALVLIIAHELDREEERGRVRIQRRRRMWQKHWIARRREQGFYHNLLAELALTDPEMYRRCLRLDVNSYEELLTLVTPHLQKVDTNMRESISPSEQLSIVLRHLATGETQSSLSLAFRVGQSTISKMIQPVCETIYTVLKDNYVRTPSSPEEWKAIAAAFSERWNFPNCIGALDGKHVNIDPPIKSGSLFYNYKKQYSIVLMALLDAEQRFIYADVGTNGRVSDGGVWAKCDLKEALDNGTLHLPPPEKIPGTNIVTPYMIVADDAFPLTWHTMKGYSMADLEGNYERRILNYRLSRPRMCSENGFGIISNRFLIYRQPMRYDPVKATAVVMSTIALHNWLRTKVIGRQMYTPPGSVDDDDILTGIRIRGSWRDAPEPQGMVHLGQVAGNRHANLARELRDTLCQYFNNEGAVPWQDRMVQRLRYRPT